MTIRPVTASAPGKVILIGEHAVVYGCPAIVATVGLRARARVAPSEGRAVELDLPVLGHRETAEWSEIRDYSKRSRGAWEEYSRRPGRAAFESVRGSDPAHLVKVALGEVVMDAGLESPPALSVAVDSELPVGAGFGSSAATAVSVVAALLVALGQEADEDRVDRIALDVERRQHGRPSGVDHKTALVGGILRFDRPPEGALRWRPVAAAGPGLDRLALFHTGEPAESTGEVVAAVRALRDGDPELFAGLLSRMGEAVEKFDRSVRLADGAGSGLGSAIREFESCLEELGVVPAPVREAIRAIVPRGGTAKISGAGALSGGAAGCLLVHWADATPTAWPELAGYRHYPVELGVEGLRVEMG